MRKIVIADQGASFVVGGNQFWHMIAKCRTAFNRARRWSPTRSEIPAHGFISTGSEASPPSIGWFILAHRHKTFEHTTYATRKARRLERGRHSLLSEAHQGEVGSGAAFAV
jgi:hypothetical protein